MNTKIKHPFQVPDQFFDHLNEELNDSMEKIIRQENRKLFALQIIKYAAIITVAVFIGRGSVLIFPYQETFSRGEETITVDLVLSQIPEEDITDLIIDNVAAEILTE